MILYLPLLLEEGRRWFKFSSLKNLEAHRSGAVHGQS